MKKRITIWHVILNLGLLSSLWSQHSIKVVYLSSRSELETFNADLSEIPASDTKALALMKSFKKYVKATDSLKHYFTLTYVGGKSEYRYDSSVGRGYVDEQFYYKDHINNKLVHTVWYLKGKQAERPLQSPLEWDICYSDTLYIGGYMCFKASCMRRGKVVSAWFTPDIPVSEGPADYSGLPGLILQISDRSFPLRAISIDVSKGDLPPIQIPDNPVKMTFEAYQKEKSKYYGG